MRRRIDFHTGAKGISSQGPHIYVLKNANARFPPPWTVGESRGISYIVRDANLFALAQLYFASGASHSRHLMMKDEARIIAATIASLREMVMWATTDDNTVRQRVQL